MGRVGTSEVCIQAQVQIQALIFRSYVVSVPCDLIFSGKSEVLSSAESHIQVLIEKHLSPFCGSRRHFQGLARAIGHNMAKGTLRTSCPRGALPASTALLVPKVQETDVVTLGLLSLPSSPTVKTSSHQLQKHNTHQVLMRK